MNHTDNDHKKQSMRLSWLLRHGANEVGMQMDAAGFSTIDDVLKHARMSRAELDSVIADNNKDRFEIRAGKVRAVQGHSLEGTPVTLDGLEASWTVVTSDELVFHGTSVAAAEAILRSDGVHAAARSHVHLAPARKATVGKRASVDILLVIDPTRLRAAGMKLHRASNGVLLTRAVSKHAVIDVEASTRAGERALAGLRALLAARA
jgi:putative RNA 2'-phosphotransferase